MFWDNVVGHAFGYYNYGSEHGLTDALPSRDAAAAFICGYVRMAFKSGILYTTGENGEGFICLLFLDFLLQIYLKIILKNCIINPQYTGSINCRSNFFGALVLSC